MKFVKNSVELVGFLSIHICLWTFMCGLQVSVCLSYEIITIFDYEKARQNKSFPYCQEYSVLYIEYSNDRHHNGVWNLPFVAMTDNGHRY